jgi:hypothetical protein
MIFFFCGIAFSFLPFVKSMNILGILKLERFEKEIAEVKTKLLLGEVVSDQTGNKFYIDGEGRHPILDERTADFMKTNKGVVSLTIDEINKYPRSFSIDSVLTAPLRILNNTHIFIILNGKKYYVSSHSFLTDWGRNDWTAIVQEELQQLPTGK